MFPADNRWFCLSTCFAPGLEGLPIEDRQLALIDEVWGRGARQSDISTSWSITRLSAWLFLFFQGVSASAAIALMTLIKRGFISLWPLMRDDVEALGLAFEVWRMCCQRTTGGSVCQPASPRAVKVCTGRMESTQWLQN